jgi:hypothetical protein
MSFNALTEHRPLSKAYNEQKSNPSLSMASEYRRATDERAPSATGHYDSGSVAFTVSPRCCRAPPYTSSGVLRFTDRLFSLRPFGVRLVVHLEVISSELRPPLGGCPRINVNSHWLPVNDKAHPNRIRFPLKSRSFRSETVGSGEIVVLKNPILDSSAALSSA